MEKIKRFLKNNVDSGYGSGSSWNNGAGSSSGSSSGFGYGTNCGAGFSLDSDFGYGFGRGSGSSSGFNYGSGYGAAFSSGSGYGDGTGSGSGWGMSNSSGTSYGDGDGSGWDNGSGYRHGIKMFNGNNVYSIDNLPTIIVNVKGNLAKGFLLNDNLTLEPCYIVKRNNLFAHGKTLEKARIALQEKIYASMDTEEVIEDFLETFTLNKSYPAKEFYIWHNRLTGSCEMGRTHFAKEHSINLDQDKLTVQEFIELTRNVYGGDIIKQLAERIESDKGLKN